MYDRNLDGRVLEFGVSGKLIMNVLVMYDRQTESYWSQLLGEAVAGEYHGEQLEFVPSWFTTWEAWKERYPDTLALDKGRGNTVDSYESYYRDDDTGIIPETFDDDRLPAKSFVIGVENDGDAVAYSFRALRDERYVNDTVGGAPIFVVYLPEGEVALVYDRRLDGVILTFTVDEESGNLVDEETGTIWDPWRGLAIEGELEGQVLRRMQSTRSFWFGWKDWYPDTRVVD